MLTPFRRGFLLLLTGLALIVYAVILLTPEPTPRDDGHSLGIPRSSAILPSPDASPAVSPDEIFRRVFWKRPEEGDRILHAERRSELLPDGRTKWRSFLGVEASPALLDYLRKENAFGLLPLAEVKPVPDAPKWFVIEASSHQAFVTPQGGLKVFFSTVGNRLYAVSEATSFTAPAAETPSPPSSNPVPSDFPAGRLPAAPPPSTR